MKKQESRIFFRSSENVAGDHPRMLPRLDGALPTAVGEPQANSRRIEYLQQQMKLNSRRDLHLWVVVIVVIVVLAVGLAGVLAPGLLSKTMSFHLDFRYLPQLFWGMIVLVSLFSVYATSQKREVNATRTALVQELIISEQLQAFSFLDPATQLLNSGAIENIAGREAARANRLGCALTFAAIGLDNLSSIRTRFGKERADQALYYAARLLKATFRGSDALFRGGPAEFLVLMPDTSEEQAEIALSRLKISADRWNADTDTGLELSFSYGIALHVTGENSADVIERARRCMFLSSQKVNLVF
jgi:diguanylate cyclase (GGDEF)-like protein